MSYRALIAELTDEQLNRQFPHDLIPDDVSQRIDAHVIEAWLGIEGAGRDFEVILGDVCAQRLTSDAAKTALCAIAIGNEVRLQSVLKAALVEQVARDVCYAVNKAVDEFEPTEAQLTRVHFPSQVMDPVADDRRHYARVMP